MNFTCDEKWPGFAEFDLFLIEETSNWPLVVTDGNSSDVVFTPYENNVEAILEPDSINVKVDPKQSSDGEIQQISISFRLITRSEALEQLLEQYANKPCVGLGKLNNDFKKLYGTELEPLYMNYEINDGTKPDGEAYTLVNIKGETRKRPVYYTPVL
ncbi:hypothetical protein [Flavobacterium sp. F52]|uniref:hypothetical protein n=1 Tax=Flavobacterium sp. F52 TaxID=1202532 RepID=UPI000272DFCB|nr:hypothetical protein [Flavobacterium sp. F52]EJG02275.1 hypothetical protein FF52_06330 [Flavobacterium sp. F52]